MARHQPQSGLLRRIGRRRRLNGADLSRQCMEDMIQVATLAYWKHHHDGHPVPFCFVCARQAAEKYDYRKILSRDPRRPLSLDAPLHHGGDPPHEWLAPATPAGDDTLRLDWLSDEVLEAVLFEACGDRLLQRNLLRKSLVRSGMIELVLVLLRYSV